LGVLVAAPLKPLASMDFIGYVVGAGRMSPDL
jgi:hypothetical protein